MLEDDKSPDLAAIPISSWPPSHWPAAQASGGPLPGKNTLGIPCEWKYFVGKSSINGGFSNKCHLWLPEGKNDDVVAEDEKGNGVVMFYVVEASLSAYLFAFVSLSVLILVS